MCGIAGRLNHDRARPVDEALLGRMADAVAHRGPDDRGLWVRENVGLAHRRLSIIGLDDGHQPLCNEDGSVWVVFNGEIYNYRELRERLRARGHVFRTATDSEVLVHLYEECGAEMVGELVGMFGFALFDTRRELLLLARDRVGIKPLYYAETDGALLFASELKSLLEDPDIERRVDPRVLDRFFTFLYLPGEETLLAGVKKLPPGHRLVAHDGKIEVERYWDLAFRPEPVPPGADRVEELSALLTQVVADHMIADVPVGCLLSGGVDSTAVLSMAVEAADEPVSTFTIGFDAPGIADERAYARLAAERFGTRHHEITLDPHAFADFLPRYVWHMEEPVVEPPAIALYFVSKLAAEHVKVVLSGEGGDEAFAGYANYASGLRLERLRRAAGGLAAPLAGVLRGLAALPGLGRLGLAAQTLALPPAESYTSRTWAAARPFDARLPGLYGPATRPHVDRRWSAEPARAAFARAEGRGALGDMLYVDSVTWLPDDLLVKADKITMANSLELRVPLLDHRVLEFAARLPERLKLDGRASKVALRRCFEGRVPREILARPKAGFPVPYEGWFRRELRGRLRDLLLEGRTVSRGYFERRGIERVLDENDRHGAHAKQLFGLAVLELWHRQFVDGERSPTL